MHGIQAPLPTWAAVALAAAALTVGGIMATATVASAAPQQSAHPKPSPSASATASATPTPKHPRLDPTKLSISNKVIAHGKHHGDVVSGVLTSDDAGVASEKITLESRSGVSPRWTVVTTGTTATGGTVSFTVSPKVKTQYQLVFAGDSTYKASDSNVITLRPVKLRRPGPGTAPAHWR